jgi:hypothetical protein
MHKPAPAHVPELDSVDLEAIQLYFEVEDRWECYRDLQLCIKFLVDREKVHPDWGCAWLKSAIVKYSDRLVGAIGPEVRISAALELLNELLMSGQFPLKEETPVKDFSKHVSIVLIGFKKANAIPHRINIGRETVLPRKRLRIEEG